MTVLLDRIDLARGVAAAFTGRSPSGEVDVDGPSVRGDDDPSGLRDRANLAHHRPHAPSLLAAARRSVADRLQIAVDDLHLMRQVHGSAVGTIGPRSPRGAEIRHVDALVTDQPGRALVVQAADCVPVVAAYDDGPIGVAHAGRAGVEQAVVVEMLAALAQLRHGSVPQPLVLTTGPDGATSSTADHTAGLHVAVGPSIGGCCYEVPDQMAAEVAEAVRSRLGDAVADLAVSSTTWGTTSLDLPAVVAATARAWGVADVRESPGCTRCGGSGRWFSHRRDPASGRHWGVVVRQGHRSTRRAVA